MKFELLFSIIALAAICISCSGKRPSNLGAADGKLNPCPSSPNCVSSQAPSDDKEHFIEPLKYSSSLKEAKDQLGKAINSMKRAKIITEKENYLYAEFTSALFRFVDDVEFYFDEANKTIHVRSASRLGYGDLGVNRKRVEELRSIFSK